MISVKKVSLQDINTMRIEHLKSLPESQDLFLELQIRHADAVEFAYSGNTVGYAILKGREMLEFFIQSTFQSDVCLKFPEIVKSCCVGTILVQSFDQVLLSCCSRIYPYHEVGILYRDYTQVTIPKNPDISFRPATIHDLPYLLMQEDEVFEPNDMISGSIEKNEIILCLNSKEIVGSGFITRIHPLWEYYDIGVWVVPAFRRLGYGTQILSRLKETCIKKSWVPVCGCGIENHSSKLTLKKNGFISNHRLFGFDVTE